MSDKESEESWINPEQDRGWSQESYRAYMKRRDAEEEAIKKGTYEYEYGKPSDKQIGGSHYKDCVIQPVDYIVKNNLDFLEGNIVKYISRYDQKGGVKDLKKAKFYLDKLIEREVSKNER